MGGALPEPVLREAARRLGAQLLRSAAVVWPDEPARHRPRGPTRDQQTELAPFVGSDVERIVREASARRGALPVAAISLRERAGAGRVADWVRGQLDEFRAHGHLHSSMHGVPDHHDDHPHAHICVPPTQGV